MLAEVFITEFSPDGIVYPEVYTLQGDAKEIVKEIAHTHADMTAMCHSGMLANYTLLLVFIDENGKVHVR
jgi:hypothetical protein